MRGNATLAALAVATVLLTWGGGARAAALNWAGTATVHLYPDDNVNAKFRGGGVATVNGSSGVLPDHLDAIRLSKGRGLISGEHTHFVTDPELAAMGLAAVQYLGIEGMTGTIGGSFTTGRHPGPMPVRGIVHICLLNTACTVYAAMPLTEPTTINGVAGTGIRGLGVGGILTVGGYGKIRVSVQMAPWTIKTVTGYNVVSTPEGEQVNSAWTMAGFAHGPASGSSSTATPGGFINLVTPAQIETNMPTGFGHPTGRLGGTVGSVVSLTIRFIPEPEKSLLLGAGLVGLGLLVGIRRRR